MADGPRCKRRKQANPKRSNVTNFNNGLEASSDSDDEDKLHIVEEDSLQEPEAAATAAAAAAAALSDGTALQDSRTAAPVLSHNGFNGVKEECMSEDEDVKDTLVEQILQQGDTAIIYPEAPEDDQSPAETGGADENGTPDSFSQLHTCPYCSRGYKRNASLKEHIKYRHETSEDNYSCSHCSYTFTYRSQLERHMSHHRGARDQRHILQSAAGLGGATGTRKFKCNECSKAFKYKHHLKEHLRIHSGEKPYECSNCKKRFSHSGSYSSHISSKKCVSAAPPNGTPRSLLKVAPAAAAPATQVVIAPARGILKEKSDSRLLPAAAIKSEPVEYECKAAVAAAAPASAVKPKVEAPPAAVPAAGAGAASGPQGVAMMVPTVGLMSPVSINLNDLQSVLKVAMDGNVLRQVLGSANGVAAAATAGKQGVVVQQAQQQIISLPAFVDHDGTTKIIINYSISPAAAATAGAVTQPASLSAKSNVTPPMATAAADPTPSKTDRPPTPEVADLSKVKTEPESLSAPEEGDGGDGQAEVGGATCLLCDDCPDNLEALHLLQHHKAANGEAVDSAALDPSFAALLSEAGVTLEEPPVDDLLSLLKTYFASNARPSEDDLSSISRTVSIPVEVVRKWFAKMNAGKKPCAHKKTEADDFGPAPDHRNGEAEGDSGKDSSAPGLNAGDLVIVKSEPEDAEVTPSQAEPLDLSLPKHLAAAMAAAAAKAKATPTAKQQEQPLNLTCLRKEQLEGRTIYVTAPQAGSAVNIVAAAAGAGQLPTLVAIAGQGGVSCLSAINATSKRTILIPQLTYTYATTAGNAAGAKTVVLNGHKQQQQKQEKKPDSSSDSVSAAEEQNDSDSAALKKRRLDNGVYPCDLCSKVFQKGSSLLRHKYEHTGRRPHECSVCNKAFKHKHHLIEHSRLHSGEKPYQCDKCGKRFSHSGSYSQHMNHRYSYCKKDGSSLGAAPGARSAAPELGSPDGGGLQSDSRTTTPPSQLDSDERESEEDYEDDDEAMCMDDIRVVQVDDGECEIYEGNFDEEEGEGEKEEEGEEREGEEEAVGTEEAATASQEEAVGGEERVEEATTQREEEGEEEGGDKGEEEGEPMEKDGEGEREELADEAMEVELGENHAEDGTEGLAGGGDEGAGGEEKEEVAASEGKEEMADCDEDADSGGIQPSEEAETEAK